MPMLIRVLKWKAPPRAPRKWQTTLAMQGEASTAAQPFKRIPGPADLPVIRSSWTYFPWVGFCDAEKDFNSQWQKFQRYGPIVKEVFPGGRSLVNLYDLKDVARIPEEEGKYPDRSQLASWDRYKELRPQWFKGIGILTGRGQDWLGYRKMSQAYMLKPQSSQVRILPVVDRITSNLLKQMDFQMSPEGKLTDFSREVKLATTEVLMHSVLGISVGALRPGAAPSADAQQLIDSVRDMFIYSARMERSPVQWWRWLSTPAWKKFVDCSDSKLRVIEKYFELAKEQARCVQDPDEDSCLLHHLMRNETFDKREIFTMCHDLLIAGVDAVTGAVVFNLFYLAKYPLAQERVLREMNEALPSDGSPVAPRHLEQLHFMKAVVKETFRLRPENAFIIRKLDHDAVFSGYNVPKGVVVMAHPAVVCMQEDIFPSPSEFKPERWIIRKGDKTLNVVTTLNMFGYGVRACVGQRLAQYMLWLSLAKVLQKYRVEWDHPRDLGYVNRLFNEPDMPLQFKFVPRH